MHTEPILFEAHVIREAQAIAAAKKASERANLERIDTNKATTAKKKEAKAAKKAERALQAKSRAENMEEIAAEEKAEQRAQKNKEKAQKKAVIGTPIRAKTSVKTTKALGSEEQKGMI